MAPCTWSPPHICVTISTSYRAFVPTRNQEIVPPSHNHTKPPGTPSNRSTCHTHTTTVSLWELVRHLVRHRDTTVPFGAPPWHHRITVRHRATWSATVPPGPPQCRRRTDTTPRHSSVHPRSWQLSIISLYFQTMSDAISPYGLLLK